MYYLYLTLAIVLECGGTYCMKLSDGFSQIVPSIACLLLYAGCFWTFSKALQGIPLSIAYASWGALGIILATGISYFVFKEPLTPMIVIGIIVCVVGVVLVNMGSSTQ